MVNMLQKSNGAHTPYRKFFYMHIFSKKNEKSCFCTCFVFQHQASLNYLQTLSVKRQGYLSLIAFVTASRILMQVLIKQAAHALNKGVALVSEERPPRICWQTQNERCGRERCAEVGSRREQHTCKTLFMHFSQRKHMFKPHSEAEPIAFLFTLNFSNLNGAESVIILLYSVTFVTNVTVCRVLKTEECNDSLKGKVACLKASNVRMWLQNYSNSVLGPKE